MKTFIGFSADDMFIGSKPPPEEISLVDFQTLLSDGRWTSRRSLKDETQASFLKEKTGITLPFGSTRLMYLATGDIYVEIKVSKGSIRFFRYRAMPAASI